MARNVNDIFLNRYLNQSQCGGDVAIPVAGAGLRQRQADRLLLHPEPDLHRHHEVLRYARSRVKWHRGAYSCCHYQLFLLCTHPPRPYAYIGQSCMSNTPPLMEATLAEAVRCSWGTCHPLLSLNNTCFLYCVIPSRLLALLSDPKRPPPPAQLEQAIYPSILSAERVAAHFQAGFAASPPPPPLPAVQQASCTAAGGAYAAAVLADSPWCARSAPVRGSLPILCMAHFMPLFGLNAFEFNSNRGFWRMGETSGTTMYDCSGRSRALAQPVLTAGPRVWIGRTRRLSSAP